MHFEDSLAFAREKDGLDELTPYREQFHYPKDSLYFCGHSLGLQARKVKESVAVELDKWSQIGVEGHFNGERPWLNFHTFLTPHLAKLVGGKEEEVVACNSLTTNLHLLMVSFYQPKGKKCKIVIEKGAFPSDRYAVLSQLKYHGFDESCLLEIEGDDNDFISNSAFATFFEEHHEEIALVLLGGVNYLSGQCFPLSYVGELCRKYDFVYGLDLAHAAGNVVLDLHEWQVDFAVWCSYKYLNGGPGTVGGMFVHQKHHTKDLPRFEGWWGNKESNRFLMNDEFDPAESVEAWQLSNAPVVSMASLLPSLEFFSEVGMQKLRKKSIELTSYLEFLLVDKLQDQVRVLTTKDIDSRGAQLSFVINGFTKQKVDEMANEKIYFDWRESRHGGLIRMAPMPFYNSFEDVYRVVDVLVSKVKK